MEEFIYIKENSLSQDICNKLIEYYITSNKDNVLEIPMMFNLKISNKDIMFDIRETIKYELETNLSIYTNQFYECLFNGESLKSNVLISDIFVNNFSDLIDKDSYHFDNVLNEESLKDYSMPRMCRILKFIWYLNDVENGGETEFFGKYKINPQIGKLVIFPTEWFIPYCEKTSSVNNKYTISGWISTEIY